MTRLGGAMSKLAYTLDPAAMVLSIRERPEDNNWYEPAEVTLRMRVAPQKNVINAAFQHPFVSRYPVYTMGRSSFPLASSS